MMLKFVSSKSAVGVKILLALALVHVVKANGLYLQNSIGCLSDSLFIFLGCRSDSLLILLVVGFDDLSYRQKNIRSKFKVNALSNFKNFFGENCSQLENFSADTLDP